MKWLNVAGLIFNLVGAGVIAAGVIASRAVVDRVTATLFGGPNPAAQADRASAHTSRGDRLKGGIIGQVPDF